MSLKLGNTNINKIYLGNTEVNKVYLGDTEVFGDGVVPPTPGIPAVEDWTSAWTGSTTVNTITVDKPAGVQVNDLILIMVGNDADERDTFPQFDDITKPAGFTLSNVQGGGNVDVSIATYWKIADGTEPATFTLTGQNTRTGMFAFALRISGADTTTPIGVVGTEVSGFTFPVTVSGVTTVENNSLALMLLAGDGGDTSPFTISTNGWLEGGEPSGVVSGTTGMGAVWAYKEMPTAGATGSVEVGSTVGVDGSISFVFSINPV